MNRHALVFIITIILAGAARPGAAQVPVDCASAAEYSALDFWIGEWDVHVGETRVGENRIEKIVGDCAITERWQDARGSAGFSLFYFRPASADWRQVWVTDGGVTKEKRMVAAPSADSVRFLGELVTPEGMPYFDRTTLLPLDDGSVRQTIEVSADGSEWRVVFDAIYTRQ